MRILAFILSFSFSFVSAQTDTIVRLRAFGGLDNDVAEEIQPTVDGGYIVIGATSSNSWGNTDGYLLKVDSNCNYEWSKALGGSNNDWGYSIKPTYDNGYIVAISTNSFGNGGYDACLMKRDSLGNYEWKKIYGGNDWDFVYSVEQTYDSGYVFCGETYNNTNGYSDVYVVKTNSLGDTLWTRTVGGSLIDKGISVIETSDSNIVVGGIRNTIADSTQMYVLKFNSLGNLLWDSIYGGSKYENINQIIEHSNGNYIMVGASTSASVGGDQDYIVKGIDKNGNSLWIFELVNGPSPPPADEEAYTIQELPNTNMLISGYSKTGGGGKKNITFFQLTPGGFWANVSAVYGNIEDDYIVSLTVDNNNHIVAAGNTNSFGNGMQDFLLMKLDTIYPGQDTVMSVYTDTIPLNIESLYSNNNNLVEIYPNPVSDYFQIKSNEGLNVNRIQIFNISGKKIFDNEIDQSGIVRMIDYSKGIYLLKVYFNDGHIGQTKIVKH